jgi:hypothetical protein
MCCVTIELSLGHGASGEKQEMEASRMNKNQTYQKMTVKELQTLTASRPGGAFLTKWRKAELIDNLCALDLQDIRNSTPTRDQPIRGTRRHRRNMIKSGKAVRSCFDGHTQTRRVVA